MTLTGASSSAQDTMSLCAEDWTRMIAGALVTFGDGATVTKLSAPGDTSALRISNLDPRMTEEELSTFLSLVSGIQVRGQDILDLTTTSAGQSMTARIQVENPNFFYAFRSALEESLPSAAFKVTPIAPTRPRTPDEPQIGCRKVVCSWKRHTQYQPRRMMTEGKKASVSPEEIRRQMTKRFGPLEYWEVLPESMATKLQAVARFKYEIDARKAAKDGHLLFDGRVGLDVHLRISVMVTIREPIFDLIQQQIQDIKRGCQGVDIEATDHPSNSHFRLVKIEGEDSISVAQAQSTLQQILLGRVASRRGKDLWHPKFVTDMEQLSGELRMLEAQYRVMAQVDERKSQLRIIGSGECYDNTAEAILKLIVHIEQLEPQPVLGTRDAAIRPGEEDDCAVCLGEPRNPTITSCGHAYCQDCFVAMARAAGSSIATREFRLSCAAMGVDQPCEKVLSLKELKTHLPTEDFEAILYSSFQTYIARRPDEYGHCRTPDCGSIFRSTTSNNATKITESVACSKCLAPTCTSCHESHVGMTCKARPSLPEPELPAELKRQLGIKDCPRCNVPIEMTQGCNHVICERGCGTHICWTCLQCFASSQQCYRHMWDVHNAIYDRDQLLAPRGAVPEGVLPRVLALQDQQDVVHGLMAVNAALDFDVD